MNWIFTGYLPRRYVSSDVHRAYAVIPERCNVHMMKFLSEDRVDVGEGRLLKKQNSVFIFH